MPDRSAPASCPASRPGGNRGHRVIYGRMPGGTLGIDAQAAFQFTGNKAGMPHHFLPETAPLRQAVKIKMAGNLRQLRYFLRGMAGRISQHMLPEPAPGQPRLPQAGSAAAVQPGGQGLKTGPAGKPFSARAMRHPAASATSLRIRALRSRAGRLMIKADIKQRQPKRFRTICEKNFSNLPSYLRDGHENAFPTPASPRIKRKRQKTAQNGTSCILFLEMGCIFLFIT